MATFEICERINIMAYLRKKAFFSGQDSGVGVAVSPPTANIASNAPTQNFSIYEFLILFYIKSIYGIILILAIII